MSMETNDSTPHPIPLPDRGGEGEAYVRGFDLEAGLVSAATLRIPAAGTDDAALDPRSGAEREKNLRF